VGNAVETSRNVVPSRPSSGIFSRLSAGSLASLGVARRLAAAFFSPRSTVDFLVLLFRNAYETALRCERSSPVQAWGLRLDRVAFYRRIRRGLSEALLDRPAPRYSVNLRKPSLPKRPRLLHIIPNVFVGGSTQLVVDLHDHLGHAYDMEVLTAAVPPGGSHDGMRIHRVGLDEPTDRLRPIIETTRPDLVHVHYWGSTDDGWYKPAFEAALSLGVPVVQNINTPIAPHDDGRIAATVCVSGYVRQTFAAHLPNAMVIYPGIDPAWFAHAQERSPDAADTVVMVYRLDRDKLDADALDPAIEAVRLRPRTRFVIVGEGPLLPVFVARVRKAGVRQNFDFRGAVPYRRLPDIYAAARVFLAPVARESFGQVVPFAMAMGLAIAGNRVGALPEILGSVETLGTSAAETGAIMAKLLDSEDDLARWGALNRSRASSFGLPAMIDAYEKLYAHVLARRPEHLSA
jgi:glycosyltransferase involved in cell wall biosynthesis